MKIKTSLTMLALGMSAFILNAQDFGGGPPPDGGGPGGGKRCQPPDPIVTALDTNSDGVISADEIANAPAALKTLDKNGDGQLTSSEVFPQPPSSGDSSSTTSADTHRPPPSPVFAALDTNHDGTISADEIANAPAALKTLDKNGDGQLTQDELRPPRPPKCSGSTTDKETN